MTRALVLILALGAALPAWGQQSDVAPLPVAPLAPPIGAPLEAAAPDPAPPPPPPTQACLSELPPGAVRGQWWVTAEVARSPAGDTWTGKAIDCTSYAVTVPAGTPLCRALGAVCPATTMTPLTFMARFSAAEQQALAQAAQANAGVMLWMLKLSAAQEVDLADPRTIEGVQALVSAGLLGADRAAQVLAP